MDDAATMSSPRTGLAENERTIGIEEELFLVDRDTWECVPEMPEDFREDARDAFGEQFKREIVSSMVEIVTRPNASMSEIGRELKTQRATLASVAARHGLAVLSLGTHPLADWKDQTLTPRPRYDRIAASLQMLSTRLHCCGLHVHVAVADDEERISVMNRIQRFLPIFLALSTSSPFWRGEPTGLKGYRSALNDETPRSGFPVRFASYDEYERYVDSLVRARFIPDPTYLWWAIRPSARYATLELRITDACTRIDDAIALAALYRSLVNHLVEDPGCAAEWENHHQLINDENRWQAIRYGIEADLIDPATGKCVPITRLVRNLVRMVKRSARALGSLDELDGIEEILARGTSADRQIEVYEQAVAAGATPREAAQRVAADVAERTLAT